jgi:hypothetical protein
MLRDKKRGPKFGIFFLACNLVRYSDNATRYILDSLFFFFFTDIKNVEVEFLRVIRNRQYCHCDDTVFVGIAYFFVKKLQFTPNLSNLEKRILVWNAFNHILSGCERELLFSDKRVVYLQGSIWTANKVQTRL